MCTKYNNDFIREFNKKNQQIGEHLTKKILFVINIQSKVIKDRMFLIDDV